MTGLVAPAVKFCGLTRAEDARSAGAAGAAFAGAIFAGGPRLLTPARAAEVFSVLGADVRRVGVFGADLTVVPAVVAEAGLDVVQLHADPTAADVEAVRRSFGGQVWAVLRVAGESVPASAAELFASADGVVLDAHVAGALGGTGVRLPWEALRGPVDRVRASGGARLVLAGGLRPDNVADAVRALAPDVVDVSSGVECAPGIKDPALVRAFADAVRHSTSDIP